MIDHTYKCIYIHVPKTGGTSMVNAFGKRWKDDGGIFLNLGNFAIPEHLVLMEKLYADYLLFAVVRNPWDRFISGWKYCSTTKSKSLIEVLRDLPIRTKSVHDWEHITLTQHEMLYKDGVLIPQVVLRFETLQEDFDKLCDQIGKPRVELKHLNITPHGHYREYFTEQEQLDLFDAHYGIDARTFGYTF